MARGRSRDEAGRGKKTPFGPSTLGSELFPLSTLPLQAGHHPGNVSGSGAGKSRPPFSLFFEKENSLKYWSLFCAPLDDG
jgi:hypothetical protein